MGIPIDTEPEYSVADCNVGEIGVVPLWADGETPKYVYLTFINMNKCPVVPPGPPLPNGQPIKCEHGVVNNCRWDGVDVFSAYWYVKVVAGPQIESYIYLFHGAIQECFESKLTGPNCVPLFSNQLNCPDPFVGADGGFAIVDWTERVRILTATYNLTPAAGTMWDAYYIPGEDPWVRVYSLRNQKTPTNIKIKFDWTAV